MNESNKIFFTSDTHFNHANIIKYCKRPFDNVEQMNEELIRRWNEVVRPEDTVYHLGDLGFFDYRVPDKYSLLNIMKRLNGKVYLILGNHDNFNHILKHKFLFSGISNAGHIYIDRKKVYMNHFPYLCFDGSESRKSIQLFGHVHSGPKAEEAYDILRLKHLYVKSQYDVGVDNNNYTPISFEEIIEKLK